MSPEISAWLCREFPSLYGEVYAFACDDSWFDLLFSLSRALVEHAERVGLRLVVTDIKEKHGSLRYYAEGTDTEADRLIDEAECVSLTLTQSTS